MKAYSMSREFLDIARVDPGYREDRVSDFDEVEQRLPAPEVAIQASRCMGCGIPFCHGAGCPLGNPIQEFNKAVGENRLRDAYFLLSQTSPFPEFTSRVCPALCEAACCAGINFDPVAIRQIEYEIIENAFRRGYVEPFKTRVHTGMRVAVIGSGPSGLAAAEALNKCGHEVVVFEKNVNFGGLLRYGIPDFKLKKSIILAAPNEENKTKLVGDLVSPGDFVVLVVPIDKAAPKGRLILPQQMVIRDLLDADAISVTLKEDSLKSTLNRLGIKPKLVITDSQVFESVARDTPDDILMTSFSILMARYKGNLKSAIEAVNAVRNIKKGDKILISEGCTHHRQCDDIGTVKIPRWLKNFVGEDVEFEFSSGIGFPKDLTPYKAIIHCGGCMLNEKEMKYRELCARRQGVPMTNYGVFIAFINGILQRSLEPFPDYRAML